MRATVERERTGARRRTPARSKAGRTDVIVSVLDEGVTRIRLARERAELGLFMGSPMTSETQYFLDGTILKAIITSTKTTYERSDMGADAIPVRSKDVTDFGRLETAVRALVSQMVEYGPENQPTAEQQEVLVAGYQGILAWREKAHAQMARADGQIDSVAIMLRQVMGA